LGDIVVGDIGDIGQPQCHTCTKKQKNIMKEKEERHLWHNGGSIFFFFISYKILCGSALGLLYYLCMYEIILLCIYILTKRFFF